MLSNNYTPIQYDENNPLFTGNATGQETTFTPL